MRLLNVKTMKLEEFFDKKIPKYAILSHTWGEDEVTFRDFDPVVGPRRTSAKITGCCSKSLKHGYDYVWIDTCCIDKSSSAELSEAINSMFAWYQKAEVCYVYLSDVGFGALDPTKFSPLADSRWFTRGWTLQELLAPTHLKFYNFEWSLLGQVVKEGAAISQLIPPVEGDSLSDQLAKITGIPESYISGWVSLNVACIAQKMSWASARQTTRTEDMAYCLLGMFDVAMPMLYGEGTKAFVRLQEELMKNVADHTIFAWGYGSSSRTDGRALSYFARSPGDFAGCGQIYQNQPRGVKLSHYVSTNRGLLIDLSLLRLITGDYIAPINCWTTSSPSSPSCFAMPLLRGVATEDVFYRPAARAPQEVLLSHFENIAPQPIYISRAIPVLTHYDLGIRLSDVFNETIRVKAFHPPYFDFSRGLCWKVYSPASETTKQLILLDCVTIEQVNFVLRVDYGFSPKAVWDNDFIRDSVKVSAAHKPFSSSESSLLNLIIRAGDQIDRLDWQEDFVVERVGLSSDEGYSRRLHLDRSDFSNWKIDIIRVNDPDPNPHQHDTTAPRVGTPSSEGAKSLP